MRSDRYREYLISIIAATLGVTVVMTSESVFADEMPGPLSGNVSAFSQYVFRGLSQTDQHPALQGGADFAAENGIYLGAWGSNVNWFHDMNPSDTNHVEWDLYAGIKQLLPKEFSYDLGIIHYSFPGHYPVLSSGTVRPDTTETYFGLTWRWVSLKYSRTVGDAFGVARSSGSYYTDASVTLPLRAHLTTELHVGYQVVTGVNEISASVGTNNGSIYSYADCSLNLSYVFQKRWTVSVASGLFPASVKNSGGNT
jgi:uncharacterized protein (TIGR02001 family)